ncbi:MAG: hypothetical protein KJ042_09455 [Deltaproteobacteria bacterium]|nr:hypothetical protein [Deltaproteobacteria bacterium]
MKNFRFATVHRVRALREQQQQRAFAERQQAWNAARRRVAAIDDDHERAIAEMDARRHRDFDARSDQVYLHHLGRLAHERAAAEAEVEVRETAMNEQRERMLTAMRDRRMLDKLFERFRERERVEAEKTELELIGEITIQRHGRGEEE